MKKHIPIALLGLCVAFGTQYHAMTAHPEEKTANDARIQKLTEGSAASAQGPIPAPPLANSEQRSDGTDRDAGCYDDDDDH